MPVGRMIPLENLQAVSVAPSTPVGILFPREVTKRAADEASAKEYEICSQLEPSSFAILCRRFKSSRDFEAKFDEILRDMLVAWKRRQESKRRGETGYADHSPPPSAPNTVISNRELFDLRLQRCLKLGIVEAFNKHAAAQTSDSPDKDE